MASVDFVLLTSRAIHILAAIIAIGGAIFMRLALHGAIGATLDDAHAQRLRDAVRARWARLVHVCIVLLLLTGGYNFYALALAPKVPAMPYHALFGIKLLSALAIFFIASALVGKSPGMEAMRKSAAKWLSIVALLAVVIVIVSGILSQVRTTAANPPINSPTKALPE